MASNARFAEVAALAGDPARAAMLHALMDGRALTATELASVAGIARQTASGHLARLTVAGLLKVEKQGRHRYHRLASTEVAGMMESIMRIASPDYVGSTASVPLAVAEHATRLYRQGFQYAAPFDPDVLTEFWRRCRAPADQQGRCNLGLQEAMALDWRQSPALR